MNNNNKGCRVMESVQEAVEIGIIAGRESARRYAADSYKSTEKRLYHFSDLKEKLAVDKERLQRMKTEGSQERSRGIARLSRPGYRVSPEEMLEALIAEQEATIANDEYEIEIIETALRPVKDDPYYRVIEGRYFQGLTDDEIAETFPCDKTTVYRNRKRLVSRISVWLYGAYSLL